MIQVKMFAQGVAQEISNYLPKHLQDVECSVMEQQKNNGVSLVGINFHLPGRELAPLVYMEPFYEEIRNGHPVEQVLSEIADCAEQAMLVKEIPQDVALENYDSVKDHLVTVLVNTKANQKGLSTRPHRKMEDLSLTYAIRFPMPEHDGQASVRITNELMERWGVHEETLYQDAMELVQKKAPPVFNGIQETLMAEMGMGNGTNVNLFDSISDFQRDPSEEMYVLTNQEKMNGASALAYPGVLEKISTIFPEGFYIIPSSVHECLFVPKSPRIDPKELGQMVRQINQEQLDREDVLSDRVYEYDKSADKFHQVPESVKKERGMER